MTGTTRRGFLKGSALATASGAIAGLSGYTVKIANADDNIITNENIEWDESFDVIVVGAGVAGTSAAITVATEGNGANCLLIEKGTNIPLGLSRTAGGSTIWTDDADLFYTYLKALFDGEPTTSDDILRTFADGATENLNWILSLNPIVEEMRIEEPGDNSSEPNCYPEYPELEGSVSVGRFQVGKTPNADGEITGPTHVVLFLEQCVETVYSDIIDYRKGNKLIGIVQDPQTNAVLGAVIEDENGTHYIKAEKGIVMCCGGFESNPEMLWNYFCVQNARPAGGPGNTGDGHKICEKLGADFWHMNSIAGFFPTAVTLDEEIEFTANMQYGILVGTSGRRFMMDHGGACQGVTYWPGDDLRTSVSTRHCHTNYGGEWPHTHFPSHAWFVCGSTGFNAGAFPTEDPVGEGQCYSADTIEELAELMDVPTNELVKTVNTWNGYCETGEDLSFYRPASFMVDAAIDEPPYYACKCAPTFMNTDGGPKRNAKAQILDPDGNPIPNLYSAGEFGSIWANMYQGACNFGESMIFARIAIRTMLGLEPKVYENPYVRRSNNNGTTVDSLDAIQSLVGVRMIVPDEATIMECNVYEDEGIGEVVFRYDDNQFTQRAKITEVPEDIAEHDSESMETFEYNGITYELNYIFSAGFTIASYATWYDETENTSRSLVADTSRIDSILTDLVEALIEEY